LAAPVPVPDTYRSYGLKKSPLFIAYGVLEYMIDLLAELIFSSPQCGRLLKERFFKPCIYKDELPC